jgi:L-fucose isomerase-like protein
MPSGASAFVVMPYWTFFEESTPTDLRADRERLLGQVTGCVSGIGVRIVGSRIIETAEDVDATVDEIDPGSVDVLIVASSMAAPANPVLQLVRRLPAASLVVWPCAWPARGLEDFTHADIVERGGTVGTPMITSVLIREGRPFSLIPLDVDITDAGLAIAGQIAAAAVAAQVRRSRIARLGEVLPGYEGLVIADGRLEADMGVSVVRLSESHFASAYEAVSTSEVTSRVDELSRRAVINCDEESLRIATRSVVALEALVESHTLTAGTLNCHCAGIRYSPSVAHAPCLALGESTSRGVPWTCTGDVLTATAMLITSLMSGTSLYHEIEAFDPARGEFILANSGEHDTRWSSQQPRIAQSPWWPGSVCATHPLQAGPATLVAIAQTPNGLRLVAAEGTVTSESEPTTSTASARFTWGSGDRGAGWKQWVESGAGHHSSLGRGHFAQNLKGVAHHLGMDFTTAH